MDLQLETSAQRQINFEVLDDSVTVYQNQTQLNFSKSQPIEYTHRLDLLPGSYQVMFTVDGKTYGYPLRVKEQIVMSEIFRTGSGTPVIRRQTPFEFEGKQLHLDANGKYAAVVLSRPEKVIWMLRRGAEVLWRSVSDAEAFATVELPTTGLAPGTYQLEAVTANDSRTAEFVMTRENTDVPEATSISFNANLAPALRFAAIGHQWLLRGNLAEARKSLDASISKGVTRETEVELARVDALAGRLDEARERARRLLAARPDDFQALSVLAYVETKFQDYAVAAELYRRALAVQDSPALRAALSHLPKVTQ